MAVLKENSQSDTENVAMQFGRNARHRVRITVLHLISRVNNEINCKTITIHLHGALAYTM